MYTFSDLSNSSAPLSFDSYLYDIRTQRWHNIQNTTSLIKLHQFNGNQIQVLCIFNLCLLPL